MPRVDSEVQDHYTTPQAAKILKVTDRYVRKLINAGDLEAVQDEKGRHHIPQRAVHALLENRRLEAKVANDDLDVVTWTGPSPVPGAAPDPRGSPRELREMQTRMQDLMRELGRLEGRLELTEKTQSTVEEERDRLARQLEAERVERQRLQERVEDLSRPWYRRWFRS
jgi:excisionase family DNA binding protein